MLYKGSNDASRVPPEWHGWLHGTFDELPTDILPAPRAWEKEASPNLTGSTGAYRPAGALERGGQRAAATGDYEASAARRRVSATVSRLTATAGLAMLAALSIGACRPDPRRRRRAGTDKAPQIAKSERVPQEVGGIEGADPDAPSGRGGRPASTSVTASSATSR